MTESNGKRGTAIVSPGKIYLLDIDVVEATRLARRLAERTGKSVRMEDVDGLVIGIAIPPGVSVQ